LVEVPALVVVAVVVLVVVAVVVLVGVLEQGQEGGWQAECK
jgi:hypothetical protein